MRVFCFEPPLSHFWPVGSISCKDSIHHPSFNLLLVYGDKLCDNPWIKPLCWQKRLCPSLSGSLLLNICVLLTPGKGVGLLILFACLVPNTEVVLRE